MKKQSTNIFIVEDEKTYHANKDHIGSSTLAHMLKSPAHFFHSWTNESEPSDAMERGTFIHKVILEQDIEKYAARPVKDGRLVASNTKDYKAWEESLGGKTPIHPDLLNEASDILGSACEHKQFMNFHEVSRCEQSFYGTCSRTGLKIKARCDLITEDLSTIIDVKSCADIFKFEKQIFNLGYDVRLAHYARVIEAQTGKLPLNLMFFAIESSAPYASRLFMLDREATDAAFAAWDVLANQVKVCLEDGTWPGLDQETKVVSRPAYINRETENNFFEEVV